MRKAIIAGSFYEQEYDRLIKQIENCFYDKKGPGDLPAKRRDVLLKGVIAPHAGYVFSGACQAWAYKEIAESKIPKTYIIIGPNHSGIGPDFVVSFNENWETPFGSVRTDKRFGMELISRCELVKESDEIHKNEHSIEVQLPFLLYANKGKEGQIKILPLLVKNYDFESCRKVAEAITEISEDICVIASSDFTHFGPNYSYVPFNYNVKDGIFNLDNGAIELIKKLDTKEFLDYVKRTRTTICGAGAIAVLMECMKSMFVKKVNLLQYYTSGDVIDDYTNSVSYVAMSFY
jgi:AmmeMemoRadiSam system protein B